MEQYIELIWSHKIILAHALYAIGALSAAHAVGRARTPQAAIAWCVALISMPPVAIPLYLVFGRNKFYGYVKVFRAKGFHKEHTRDEFLGELRPHWKNVGAPSPLERLAEMRFTTGNSAEILIDGENTFSSMLEAISRAEEYILLEFYIVRADAIGNKLRAALEEKARQGVRILFLYDEVGSASLPKSYIRKLESSGNVEMRPFATTKGLWNRFQLNFRNHRKIVVVDGKTAFVGGHNVGDEYLGCDGKIGYWRDTHCRLSGPVVQQVQVAFLSDWFWATGGIPSLEWKPAPARGKGTAALALPTGPADDLDTGVLFFAHLINQAEKRVWIATPYFVPDPTIIDAMTLAALRGVEIRLLIPERSDMTLPHLAAFSYLKELEASGVKTFRYKKGFAHQKTILVDDSLASIGTANFDNRSMRLNFEINILFDDAAFAGDVEKMLEEDFSNSTPATRNDYDGASPAFKLAVNVARLLAPIL